MIARIEDWKMDTGRREGRAEADRRLGEAHKLLDEISNMLTEMRRELLSRRRYPEPAAGRCARSCW
jgi:hypothetical protein